jgi:hypothetical protein
MDDGMCVGVCVTARTWANDNSGTPTCTTCDNSCGGCNGGTPNDCTICRNGLTYMKDGMCVEECGSGLWENENNGTNPLCSVCITDCL